MSMSMYRAARRRHRLSDVLERCLCCDEGESCVKIGQHGWRGAKGNRRDRARGRARKDLGLIRENMISSRSIFRTFAGAPGWRIDLLASTSRRSTRGHRPERPGRPSRPERGLEEPRARARRGEAQDGVTAARERKSRRERLCGKTGWREFFDRRAAGQFSERQQLTETPRG